MPSHRLVKAGLGYRAANTSAGVDVALAASFAVTLALVFLSTGTVLSRGREQTKDVGRVLTRLDEFTKGRTDPANSIPAFLALPGLLGAEVGDSVMEPVKESELQKGFCTSSLAELIRQRYPDDYKSLPDAELEKRVLEKHPEYRDQICHLPAWVAAAPHAIVKYEINERSAFLPVAIPWFGAMLVTVAVAVLGLNLYYRLLIARFAAKSA